MGSSLNFMFQVKDRVSRTKKTLDLDLTAEKLVLHANHMAKTMQTYVDNVKACFNHISVSEVKILFDNVVIIYCQ